MCGGNARDPETQRNMDPRYMGFPLDLQWSETNFLDTINNKNR
jgi:hypothetical protein